MLYAFAIASTLVALLLGPSGFICVAAIVIASGLALVKTLRSSMVAVLKAMSAMTLFTALIAGASIVAGEPLKDVVALYLPRLDFVLATVFFAALAGVLFEPRDVLRILDAARCPRTITYVFLSVVSAQRYVRALGNDQLALLRLKGVIGSHPGARVRAYYRILTPMLAQLIGRQFIHATSLRQRSFFYSRHSEEEPRPSAKICGPD